MGKTYYEQLPRSYFNDLYGRVLDNLQKHQNTLVSAMYGCGGKTFLNLFLHYYKLEKHKPSALFYDPLIEKQDLFRFCLNALQKHKRCLIVTRQFEKVIDKNKLLEDLTHLQYPFPERITFLIITDQSGITSPQDYVAQSTVFFSSREILAPFSKDQTKEMMEINKNYYGWDIDPSLHDKIYTLSGGIPRLIKYISKETHERPKAIDQPDLLLADPSIRFHVDYCTKLLLQHDKKTLHTLGLLENNQIRSSLLRYYFKSYQSAYIKVAFPQLAPLESTILSYLFERKGEIVSIDHLGDLLEMQGQEFSQWAIYKQISRIKPKISPSFTITNIKGQGYILKQANSST